VDTVVLVRGGKKCSALCSGVHTPPADYPPSAPLHYLLGPNAGGLLRVSFTFLEAGVAKASKGH